MRFVADHTKFNLFRKRHLFEILGLRESSCDLEIVSTEQGRFSDIWLPKFLTIFFLLTAWCQNVVYHADLRCKSELLSTIVWLPYEEA